MESKHQNRPHLTKEQRLPRSFKEVEKVLRSVKSCQQNYKTVLANSRLRGHIHKKVYSMTVNILKHYSYIQKIIDEIHLLEKEKYLKREIASILIYELIFGIGYLPGESKVVKIIQLYENDIFHAHEVLQNRIESNLIIEITIPRYVRVHTLVTTVPYVIKDLTSYGFHQVIYDSDLPEEKYLELVRNLNKGFFLIDFHFKDVLVFEHHENLLSLDLYKNGHIFLQDKSSYIPVHVLNPLPGCAVLDACAAPGMKTIHIAAKMKNKGILIACERDKSRFECLKGMLDSGSVKICKTLCKDFKLIDPSDQAYSNIEYILIDPSCSGSGMINRMDEVTDTENSKNTERLSKLAGFQIILLKHSLKFPAVKRIVYSTCSIHEEENEYVVHEALKAFSSSFKLIPAMPEWSHRGSENFEFGKFCLRTDPKMHLTNGFFVAVFERINYDESTGECYQNYKEHDDFKFKKQEKESLKQERNSEKAVQNYVNINFKQESNMSYPLEFYQMDDNVRNRKQNSENFVQTMNYEQKQNETCLHQTNKHKKKKKEKSNEQTFKSEKCLSNSKPNNLTKEKDKSKHNEHRNERDLTENMEIVQEFTDAIKLYKKKKKKKYIENETLDPDELNQEQPKMLSEQKCKISKLKHHDKNSKSELENNSGTIITNKNVSIPDKHISIYKDSEKLANMASTCKKIKEKKKTDSSIDYIQSCKKLNENRNLSNEQTFRYSKSEKCLSISESNDNLKKKKDKSKHNEHQNGRNLTENMEIVEEFTDIIKLHKKKKKKKYIEIETLNFDELNPEQSMLSKQKHKISKLKHHDKNSKFELENSGAIITNKDESIQDKHINVCKDSEKLTNMTSICKKIKKKKKTDSSIDYIQSCKKLNENRNLFSHAVRDSVDTHLNFSNKFENKETSAIEDSNSLHKKKKKKKKDRKVSEEIEI